MNKKNKPNEDARDKDSSPIRNIRPPTHNNSLLL